MKNILFILLALIFYSCSEEAGIIPDYVLTLDPHPLRKIQQTTIGQT